MTTTTTAPDARRSIGHLTYAGDVTAGIANDLDSARAFGPNYMGELMWPVDAAYDADTDTTRVGFSLLAPQAVSR